MDSTKLQTAIQRLIDSYKTKPAYHLELWKDRKERREYYQSFTRDKLLSMTEDDFYEYISKLWSMLIWGNKKYIVNKIVSDNGFENIKKQLVELLYSAKSIETRWDNFLKDVKGLGPATISELLMYVNPQEYIIFNKTTVLCFAYLDIAGMPKYNYQYTGKKYVEVCAIAKEISNKLVINGSKDADLLAVDYFI